MGTFKEDIAEHLGAVLQTASDEIKGWVNLLKEIWPLLLLLIFGFLVLIWLAKPAPPTKVMMATGPGGSYKILGEKYQAFLDKKELKLSWLQLMVLRRIYVT
jgi:hypothetical protein